MTQGLKNERVRRLLAPRRVACHRIELADDQTVRALFEVVRSASSFT